MANVNWWEESPLAEESDNWWEEAPVYKDKQQPSRQFDPSRFIAPSPSPVSKKPQDGVIRQALDIPVNIARGGVQGIKMMTDILGADNPISKSLSGVEGYMADLLSAQAKDDQEEIARILKDAEDKGFGEQVMAGIKAFSIAPVDIMSQALGTMIPVVATGLAGSAAKLGAVGVRAVQTGVGAGMGAGLAKGNIYSEVKQELLNAGIGEQEAERAAVEAQSYGGKNLDQILLSAGLGAASTIGAESIITRILTKQGKPATGGIVSRTIKGGLAEGIPESAQAAQEELATNIALQREGFDVPTMRGVVSAGTMEGIAGAAIGAPVGALERSAPLKPKTPAEESLEQTTDIARKVAESGAPLTASVLQDQAAENVRQEELAKQLAEEFEEEERSMVPIQEEKEPYTLPSKEDFKERFATQTPEQIVASESAFQSNLTNPDADARAFAQTGLEALQEFRQSQAPAPETEAQGQAINDLQSVANNTATRKQISALSEAGLVDIIKGQPVINEDGEAILAQAQAPLPALTPEERVAEIEGAPTAQDTAQDTAQVEAPAIVEQAPVVSEEGAQVSDITPEQKTTSLAERFPTATNVVDGRIVREETPNEASIESSLTDYEVLPNVREVQMSEFELSGKSYSVAGDERIAELADQIQASKEINPLIVVVDSNPAGPYILEGSTRAQALQRIGAKSFPAKIVIDKESFQDSFEANDPVLASVVEEYNIELPDGYIKDGEFYVYRQPAAPTIGEKPPTSPMIGAETTQLEPAEGVTQEVAKPTGGVDYYKQLGEQDALDTNRKKKRSVPQNFKLAYEVGWSDARKKLRAEPTSAAPETAAEPAVVPERDVTNREQMTPEEASVQRMSNEKNIFLEDNAGNYISKTSKGYEVYRLEATNPKRVATFGSQPQYLERAKQKLAELSKESHSKQVELAAINNRPISASAVDTYGITLPEGYTKQGELYVYQPTSPTAPTPEAAPAPEAPTEIAVGSRVRRTKGGRLAPNTYIIQEVLPQTEAEIRNGEQSYLALNEQTGNVEDLNTNDGPVLVKGKGKGVRKLFVGEEARMPQFMRDSLDTARAMAAAGKTSEEIRAVTGWFPGKYDGKMRWEIPDNKAVLGEIEKGTTSNLEDVLKHDSLFLAYPEAKNIVIKINNIGNYFGLYEKEKNEIRLSPKLPVEDRLKILLHELQHWIQNKEGFARGGSPIELIGRENTQKQISDKASEALSKFELIRREKVSDDVKKRFRKNYRNEFERTPAIYNWFYKSNAQDIENYKLIIDRGEYPVLQEAFYEFYDLYTNEYGKVESDPFFIEKRNEELYGKYQRIAGEIESRDIESRINLTEEQRKAIEPYSSQNIATEDAILLEEGGIVASVTAENILPVPKDKQYSFEDIEKRVKKYFGGTIPENAVIVNDTTEEYQFKGGYNTDNGQLIINQAYIEKGDSISDIINHELGHYIFGDPEFQAAFKSFYDSMTPDEKSEIDAIINTFYNKDTGQVQIEEGQVMAFNELVDKARTRSTWGKLVDAIKSWLNKTFGTSFELTDRGALAVLAAGHKRFKSGEKIVREMDAGIMAMAADTQDSRFADLERRAKAGDKEAEAEAQRMVDEAARAAGYGLNQANKSDIESWAQEVAELSRKEKVALVNAKNAESSLAALESNEVMRRVASRAIEKNRQAAIAARKQIDAGLPPKRLVRGDDVTITVYRTKEGGRSIWATDSTKVAETYGSKVTNVLLGMQNPLIYDAAGNSFNNLTFEGERLDADDLSNIAKDRGYDGLIIRNFYDSNTDDGGSVIADHFTVFSPEQIKSADPFTYDDAGNLIPLSERFQPATPDIRRMAVGSDIPRQQQRSEQLFGNKDVGLIIETPVGFFASTDEIVKRDYFDGSTVSQENTDKAFGLIEALTDPQDGSNYAKSIVADVAAKMPDVKDAVLKSVAVVRIQNELMRYAVKLAIKGDKSLMKQLYLRANRMPTGMDETVSQAGRTLSARQRILDPTIAALDIIQASDTEQAAAVVFGTKNPNKDQIDVVKEALTETENVKMDNESEILDGLTEVETRANVNLTKKIDEKIKKAGKKKKKVKDVVDSTEAGKEEFSQLDEEAAAAAIKQKAQTAISRKADNIIESLAKLQSDVYVWPQSKTNDIRTIVQQDLRQRPDMGRKEPWISMLTGKLTQAGVSDSQAQTIAELVWRQHEINSMNREIAEMEKAAEFGSLGGIIQRIKDTPLLQQQGPDWREGVIREYLLESGLSEKAAESAARLYNSVIVDRLAQAQQKAFEDTLKKSAPWKDYFARNARLAKGALEKIRLAVRTGALDPSKNLENVIAEQNGWTGFTSKQFQRLAELDEIISDPNVDDVTRSESIVEINKIVTDAKLPVRLRDGLAAYYTGQALMGIPTINVNIASPAGFALRNLFTDIAKYSFSDPSQIPFAFESFMESMRSYYDQVSYAFKNQIYRNDVVEYLAGNNTLRELFNKGKRQWEQGNYAEGFINMSVGMAQITGRVLSSLDQGAISALEGQNINRYTMAAMKMSNIPKDKQKFVANKILEARRKTKAQLVSEGMPAERAGVLADLEVRSLVMTELSDLNVDFVSVLESSLNEALQAVGRNRVLSIKGLEEEQKTIRDEGLISYPPIAMLELVAQGAAKQGPAMQIFARMLYGFALIPARVFHNAAWYSPYGFVRIGIEAAGKKTGLWSPRYAASLGNELQYRQRLTDAIAGSIVMLALASLMSSSVDDEDDDRLFRIVITGNGPDAATDRQFYDSWIKKWKQYSIHIVIKGTIIPINIGRSGEAIFFPIMLAAALDDWQIKGKLNQTRKSPQELNMATQMAGSAFFALAQRGPFAAFTKPLFDASKEGRVTEELIGNLGFFGKTFIPGIGASFTRNISDFINDPIDRSSAMGAIYANTPMVGPMMGSKALNALGQPMRVDDWGDRLFRLGVPVVFSFPKNTPENDLNELILKKGSGPSFPTRRIAQARVGRPLDDNEFETYVREYGRVMSDKMFKNRKRLENMKVSDYDKELQRYAQGFSIDGTPIPGASDMAVRAVNRMAK